VRTVLVSTGKASSPTRAGKVLSKHPSITMRGQAFLSPGVPWALCVSDDGTICLHDAPLAGAGRPELRRAPQPWLRADLQPPCSLAL